MGQVWQQILAGLRCCVFLGGHTEFHWLLSLRGQSCDGLPGTLSFLAARTRRNWAKSVWNPDAECREWVYPLCCDLKPKLDIE
jgi:hypothetical protein